MTRKKRDTGITDQYIFKRGPVTGDPSHDCEDALRQGAQKDTTIYIFRVEALLQADQPSGKEPEREP